MLRFRLHSAPTLIVIVLAGAPVAVPVLAGDTPPASGPLSFPDRVSCVERVEDVYWSHRTWPEYNPESKPPRNEIMSREQVAAKVEETLLFEAALEDEWEESLSPARIQGELDRIAQHTAYPDLLRDIFTVLGNDPFLVAECFVRPRLADRLVRERFNRDPEIHRKLRETAETAVLRGRTAQDLAGSGATVSEAIWLLDDGSDHNDRKQPLKKGVLLLSPSEWRERIDRLLQAFGESPDLTTGVDAGDPGSELHRLEGGGFSPLLEEDHAFVTLSVLGADPVSVRIITAVWPKTSFGDWMACRRRNLRPAEPPGWVYTLPPIGPKSQCVDDTWAPTSVSGVPSGRFGHSTVWTGTEMIIWGGNLWGTATNTGARYDPAADSWISTSTTGAPTARSYHLGVWTGTEMLVWGGSDYPTYFNTGGRYNPATNTWAATSTTGVPAARSHASGVWTGTEMIVWGGNDTTAHFATGGRYNPVSNTWSATSTTDAPSARRNHSAVWTGTEMIIWGGNNGGTKYNTGARYDPSTDSWTATSTTDAPEGRNEQSTVWTGSEMVVWGGLGDTYLDSGGRYDPATDTWTGTSTTDAPLRRYHHSGVWTGTEMIIWGGNSQTTLLNSGGRYDPVGDTWSATTTMNAPSAREDHTAVWPGPTPKMIVWGGGDTSGVLVDGGLYCASGIVPYDFGDAPDPTYPTLLASDGARHRLGGSLHLGSNVDADDDGRPTVNGDGDDTDSEGDDEDGVTFTSPLIPGEPANVEVVASTAGMLNTWIDFNSDGDWSDTGEQVFTDEALTAGINHLVVSVPLDADSGSTFARFRFDSTGGLGFSGGASDGEVEDYLLTIVELDFGDAPDPTFPTLLASDGARHVLGSPLFLGTLVDGETDGRPTPPADGDDTDGSDDEDGVVWTTGLGRGLNAGLEVTASAGGLLNGWIDFNSDGDWADSGEHIFVDQALATGTNSLSFPVPSGATLGTTFARFRLNSDGGLSFAGLASDGEVEDYLVEIVEGPDMEIAMAASPEPVPSGRPLTYIITVANNGPLSATSVTVTDTLPSQLSFVSSIPGSPDCTVVGDTLNCDLGTLAPAATTQITIETVLDHPVWDGFSNSATVWAAEADPISANNTVAVETVIGIFIDAFETGDTTAWD